MKILVTGIAGFIGFYTAKKAVELGHDVVGIDNLNNYYSVALKEARLKELGLDNNDSISTKYKNLSFKKIDLADDLSMARLFEEGCFDQVIHLAAQAGVRYSITNPHSYIKSNSEGFLNILEGCRHNNIQHLIYASSSSVYGENSKVPFSTKDPVDHPVSLYAATKRSNELMAHTYSHLYGLPVTGLRYFTVYGPWGRPDMAPFIFTKNIIEGNEIKVFNNGMMERDFTYVEDIVEAQLRLLNHIPVAGDNRSLPNVSTVPYVIYNIGNSSPVNLLEFIQILEKCIGVTAKKDMMPMQPGDVPRTYADVVDLFKKIDFKPSTSLNEGIAKFVEWYKSFYMV
ncbi:NAD-dependent epimerase [Halobacteriovorax sp. DA5]|uniref:NAD-dependent epimerase n=1 Tax=Halobacteriovorax sp. DA5 TaxID=2067553 RepID=UPI000CD1EB18|nr:NAD-dependent epimerase [Halobacteriovorax sp. DA5]POB13206.1 protein CapI [Halobacteriovorax sp. DA5]